MRVNKGVADTADILESLGLDPKTTAQPAVHRTLTAMEEMDDERPELVAPAPRRLERVESAVVRSTPRSESRVTAIFGDL